MGTRTDASAVGGPSVCLREDAAVSARGLVHRYGRHAALAGVDVEVRAGRVTGVLGPNGAGKSTLVHAVVGMLDPTGGTLSVFGVPPADAAAASLVGFCYDDLPLPLALTGREALALAAAVHAGWDAALCAELTSVLGMDGALGMLVGRYSHGMKRKLQVIASVSYRPALWVLDEPFRGLDPTATAVLHVLLRRYADAGNTVLVATHDLLAAERLCDDVVIITDGTVAGAGTPAALGHRRPGDLQRIYLERTGLAGAVHASTRRITALHLGRPDENGAGDTGGAEGAR